jgi:hypothetical protein
MSFALLGRWGEGLLILIQERDGSVIAVLVSMIWFKIFEYSVHLLLAGS